MRAFPEGVKSVPFSLLAAVGGLLLKPAIQAEGAITGETILFSEVGFDAMLVQATGAVADSGALVSTLKESDDNSTFTDLAVLPSQGASAKQTTVVRITKPYLKLTGVVSGGGSGTIGASAVLIY